MQIIFVTSRRRCVPGRVSLYRISFAKTGVELSMPFARQRGQIFMRASINPHTWKANTYKFKYDNSIANQFPYAKDRVTIL